MKTLFFVFFAVLCFAFTARATELKGLEKGDGGSNDSACYAWTDCWNGMRISCESYGAGCRYYWQAGRFVRCEGYGYYGEWYTNYQYCP